VFYFSHIFCRLFVKAFFNLVRREEKKKEEQKERQQEIQGRQKKEREAFLCFLPAEQRGVWPTGDTTGFMSSWLGMSADSRIDLRSITRFSDLGKEDGMDGP
jgi:hypothetical protein